MDKRVTLALEDLKKTNYYMIGLILVSLTLIILLSNNVLSVNSNNKHYKDFVYGYQTGLSFSLLIFPCINLISNFFLAFLSSGILVFIISSLQCKVDFTYIV